MVPLSCKSSSRSLTESSERLERRRRRRNDCRFRLKADRLEGKEKLLSIHAIHDRTDRIQSLAYSPQGDHLAVGSADGNLDIYQIQAPVKDLRFKDNSEVDIHGMNDRLIEFHCR